MYVITVTTLPEILVTTEFAVVVVVVVPMANKGFIVRVSPFQSVMLAGKVTV